MLNDLVNLTILSIVITLFVISLFNQLTFNFKMYDNYVRYLNAFILLNNITHSISSFEDFSDLEVSNNYYIFLKNFSDNMNLSVGTKLSEVKFVLSSPLLLENKLCKVYVYVK